jgi:probable selenium-dependent hydroxylase accessory protein YqeC
MHFKSLKVRSSMSSLSDLIDLLANPLISIVGAGGKTTTMYTLANELAQGGMRVITTTTTQIFFPRSGETGTLIVAEEMPALLKLVSAALKQHHHVTVAGAVTSAGKLDGLQPEQPYELLAKSGADAVIVEADGARHRMIKAPSEREPVVPPQTNVALLMMSAGAINQPLSAQVAHRPEHVAGVAGINQGDILTPSAIARLMTSDQGAFKNIPESAATYLLITHATMTSREAIQELISLVRLSPRIAGVLSSTYPGEWRDIWMRKRVQR